MELDRELDNEIAVTVIDQVRKLARGGVEEGADDVYWPCLAAAALFLLLGIACVRDRAELALATVGRVRARWPSCSCCEPAGAGRPARQPLLAAPPSTPIANP